MEHQRIDQIHNGKVEPI